MAQDLRVETMSAGRGWSWITQGFDLFKRAPGVWIGIVVSLFLLQAVAGSVPFIGSLANSLLSPVFGAGILFGCRDMQAGGELKFMHLFEGFRSDRMGSLILLGFLILLLFVVLAMLLGGTVFMSMSQMPMDGSEVDIEQIGASTGLIGAVLVLLLLAPVLMAIWFTTQLVALHGLEPWPAMRASFRACARNIAALTVYGLLLIPLAILAMLPAGLGLLILAPTVLAANYYSYVEIFAVDAPPVEPPVQEPPSIID